MLIVSAMYNNTRYQILSVSMTKFSMPISVVIHALICIRNWTNYNSGSNQVSSFKIGRVRGLSEKCFEPSLHDLTCNSSLLLKIKEQWLFQGQGSHQ